MKPRAITVVLASLLAAALQAQQTWKVNCSGAYGAQFLDIPAALAAASPGDTILVYGDTSPCTMPPGQYTMPLVDKGVNIVGFFLGMPPGNNTPTHVAISGPIVIANIPASQKLVITNVFALHQLSSSSTVGSPITVMDCDGTVLIEDLTFLNNGMSAQVFRIERCDNVILRGCSMTLGGAPLYVIDSNVLMTSSFIQYYPPHPLWWLAYTVSTPAMDLTGSTVTLAGSAVQGPGVVITGYPAMPAALMRNSTLRVGATSLLRGGLYPGGTGISPFDFTPAYVFANPGPHLVEKDPRAPVFNSGMQPPPVLTPIDETYHDWVVADEFYNVRVVGPQGGFALLCVSDMIFPTPSPWGILGIDPNVAQPISLVALPASTGIYNWTFFCPSQVQNGYAFGLQSLTLSTAGTFGLTQPSPLTVAWDKTAYP